MSKKDKTLRMFFDIKRSIKDFMADEDGFISKEAIVKVGFASVAGCSMLGNHAFACQSEHYNWVNGQEVYTPADPINSLPCHQNLGSPNYTTHCSECDHLNCSESTCDRTIADTSTDAGCYREVHQVSGPSHANTYCY